ncbi:hypothetical protein ASG06_18350 [Rathayibacter sp. Leaf185]|nr:hypothetical protein ASF42_17615 [Rathayibacter sp. Leaf294]KQS07177.1 hypothetical protein ASG06_18350 [Rathayibacter sp. Leaf185]
MAAGWSPSDGRTRPHADTSHPVRSAPRENAAVHAHPTNPTCMPASLVHAHPADTLTARLRLA